MGSRDSREEEMFLGPWGGAEGKQWVDYKPKGGIKTIIISYDILIINSIRFVEHGSDEMSPLFGSEGGEYTTEINIDYTSEYLIGICGHISPFPYYPEPLTWVFNSLVFNTNVRSYGATPHISVDDVCYDFSSSIEGGKIIGFRFRAREHLNEIGVYTKPICSSNSRSAPNLIHDSLKIQVQKQIEVIENVAMPRHPDPWGGRSGKRWDDGVFSGGIKQIQLYFCEAMDKVHAIRIAYVRRDGKSCVWMPKHGGNGGNIVKTMEIIDCEREFLIEVSGHYGMIDDGMCVIRSITFHTNKGRYGPFGIDHNGTYFSSLTSRGKILGFHGRSGSYLNSIGVHFEYS